MKEFFTRLSRWFIDMTKRFLRNQPDTPYEDLAFRALREVANLYSRRVIVR